MKIIVAFDSFKGSLSAQDACRLAAEELRRAFANAYIEEKPMADGGEGTAAILLASEGGEWIPRIAEGPLPGMRVAAGFARLSDGETAVVETASASGWALLRPHQRNPLRTTTFGTGQLIAAACEGGCRHILLAAGGSATVDGGIGAASALRWRFPGDDGHELPPCGGSLARISRIIPPPSPLAAKVTVLCDVTNPLLGSSGAAPVFGPQKGATPEMVKELEAGLAHLAKLIRLHLGIDVSAIEGGGAAGGLAAGAAAFFGAHLVSGGDYVIRRTRLNESLEGADWVITGEGSFDAQSLGGKIVSRVTEVALRRSVRVAVIAGRVKLDADQCRARGISHVDAVSPEGMAEEEAIQRAPELLRSAVRRFAARVASEIG